MITGRDRRIINFLQDRDFCLYKDITTKFFPSEVSACNRLKKLSDRGWITIEPIQHFYLSKDIKLLSLHLMGDNKKIVRLNRKHKIIKRGVSCWKTEQQLILFSLKERLENILGHRADLNMRSLRDLHFTMGTMSLCLIFILKVKVISWPVELNLHLRRNSRYNLKMSQYEGSSQSYVLYIVTNAKKITRFIKNFRSYKYVGIAHYFDVQKLISYWYGEISLCEWLKKDLNPRSPSPRF
ncbi:MAG: hypothetical protein OXM55_02205 [Bdellovibrionales bacterium]|nr:hypothetical protein [Bdellovibrionales bacterium]